MRLLGAQIAAVLWRLAILHERLAWLWQSECWYNVVMKYDAYIFDLDGTLLDTLPDLVFLTNRVLEENGFPVHTRDEINSYVGNGARMLLKRAVPDGTPDDQIDAMMEHWKELYPVFGHKYTKPYPGMEEALGQLKGDGAKLGVLSNKFDAAVRDVIGKHFPGVFDIARGEGPDTPRKPDPTGLLTMMSDLGVSPNRVAYVGDSGSDMTVAVNAGTFPVGVSWGYRCEDELLECGAQVIIGHPSELLTL